MKQILFTRPGLVTSVLAVIAAPLLLMACLSRPTVTPAGPTPSATPERTSSIILPAVVVASTSAAEQPPALVSPPLPQETSPAESPATPSGSEVFQPVSPIQPPDTPSAEAGQASGPVAPDFTLDSVQGEPVTLSDYQGESYVVLVFYRGQT
jgi:hypothetical protein